MFIDLCGLAHLRKPWQLPSGWLVAGCPYSRCVLFVAHLFHFCACWPRLAAWQQHTSAVQQSSIHSNCKWWQQEILQPQLSHTAQPPFRANIILLLYRAYARQHCASGFEGMPIYYRQRNATAAALLLTFIPPPPHTHTTPPSAVRRRQVRQAHPRAALRGHHRGHHRQPV